MFKALKGLLAGLLAGTAVGMLFSPKKGSEIRKDFKKEFKAGGIGLNTAKTTLGEMGKDIGDTCKDAYDSIPEDKKNQAKKVLHEVKNKIVGK